MDVFVVTHSPIWLETSPGMKERRVTTDVWRIFSEAKGSALFHNTALDQICDYYIAKGILTGRAWTFTDGCRGQYKGKRNFRRIAEFPSKHPIPEANDAPTDARSYGKHDPCMPPPCKVTPCGMQ